MNNAIFAKRVLIDMVRNHHYLKTDTKMLEESINQICEFKDNEVITICEYPNKGFVIEQDGNMYLLTFNHIDYLFRHKVINRSLIL